MFSLYTLMTSWYQSDMDGPRGHPRLPGGAIPPSFAPQPPGDVVAGTGDAPNLLSVPVTTGTVREEWVVGARVWWIWVTSVVDDADHAVTDENMAAGMADGSGTYLAMCGFVAVPGSMAEPPSGRCPRCVAFLRFRSRNQAHAPVARQRPAGPRHAKPGLLARVFVGWQ